jgi:hypothetical protein
MTRIQKWALPAVAAVAVGLWAVGAIAQIPSSGVIRMDRILRYVYSTLIEGEYVSLVGDLGPELTTNGDFSSATGWTVGAGWAIAGGTATHTPGSTAALSQATAIPTARAVYEVQVTTTSGTAGVLSVKMGEGDWDLDGVDGAQAWIRFFEISDDVTALIMTPDTDYDGVITLISIRRLPALRIGLVGTGDDFFLAADSQGAVRLIGGEGYNVDDLVTFQFGLETDEIFSDGLLSLNPTGDLRINGTAGVTATGFTKGVLTNSTVVLTSVTSRQVSSGATPGVSDTVANSCGTGTETITGNDNAGKVTVIGSVGTSCTVTFATPFVAAPSCFVSNEITANLARATSTATTVILAGVFAQNDVLAYGCS